MEKTRKLLGIIMTFAVCMGLGVFVNSFTTHAERTDTDTLYVAEVETNEDGEVMLPDTQAGINGMRWYTPDGGDGYVHWGAFSHKRVVFAYKGDDNNMIIIKEDIAKMSVSKAEYDNENNKYKKLANGENQLSDFMRQYSYNKWEEGANDPETINVPGVFEMGLYDAWFIIEYDGHSMTICSDKPSVGIYIKKGTAPNTWFEYAAWDRNFEYEEGMKYYIGCKYYLGEEDETLKKESVTISLEGTDGFVLNDATPIYEYDDDSQMVYRAFNVKNDFISSFDLNITFEYETNKNTQSKVETERFVAEAKREGLVVVGCDREEPFRNDYGGARKYTEQYVRDECGYSFGIADSTHETMDPVTRAEGDNPLAGFTITNAGNGTDASGDATISVEFDGDKTTEDGVYILKFNKCGTYRITYKSGDVTSFIEVKAKLPNIGIYKAADAKDENLLGDPSSEVEYKAGETYYVVMSPDTVEEAKNKLNYDNLSKLEIGIDKALLAASNDTGIRKWSDEEDPTYWAFTVPQGTIATMRPGIRAEWVYEDGRKEDVRQINLHATPLGLVISEAFYDEGPNQVPYPDKHNELSKVYDAERCCENEVNLGLADEAGNITKITTENISKFKILENGVAVGTTVASIVPVKRYNEDECEDLPVDGYFILKFNENGIYTLEYNEATVVEIHVKEPTVAIYDTQDVLIGGNVEYTNTDRVFNVKVFEQHYDYGHEEITIKDVIFTEGTDEFVECKIAPDGKSVSINIADPKVRRFTIAMILDYAWFNSNESDGRVHEQESRWLSFEPGDDICEAYLDGEPQQGFSGCYIPEDWFINGNWTSESQYPMFWVHAKSVQDVINKLSETAVGDKFEGYYTGPDGNLVKAAKNVNIVNTGYIAVFPSTYGGEALEPQYVASSGNLKGISFGSFSKHDYFVKPDEEGNYSFITKKTGKSGDFVELGVFDARSVKAYLESSAGMNKTLSPEQKNAFDNAKAVTIYKGAIYSLDVDHGDYTSRDGVKKEYSNYTFENTTPIIDGFTDKEETKIVKKSAGSLEITENFVGLHVNAYCDMKFIGDMGKLVIGYPDKDLASNNGNYFDTKIGDFCKLQTTGNSEYHDVKNLYRDIKGPDAYPNGKDITQPTDGTGLVDGDGNDAHDKFYKYDTDIPYSYKLYTYAISSESKVEGTFNGVDVVVPEPNALTELTYEQKDAIESGQKLTVSMNADALDEKTASDSAKEGIDAIKEQLSKDKGSEYGRVDYIDLSVKASVGNNDTKITETAVPMEVTIPIPKGYKKNSIFRIARYHKDKKGNTEVFFLDRVESLRGEIGLNIGYVVNKDNTLTFFTDRFSTYALMEVGGDSRTEIDFSKTAWNYTGAFTSDGVIKKVELTGVPEGVNVAYSDNEATAAGKYIAKATFTVKDVKAYKLPATIPDKIKTLEWEIKEPAQAPAPVTPEPTTPIPAEVGQTITDTSGAAQGSTFKVTETGETNTVAYSGPEAGSTASSVTIPDTIVGTDGKTYDVKEILPGALANNNNITKLVVGKNVKTIGEGAVQGASKLKELVIGESVETIEKNAFAKCPSLQTVKVKGKKLADIKDGAFSGAKKLKKLDLSGAKVKNIGKNIVNGCKNLTDIRFNANGLKKVNGKALNGVNPKAKVTIRAKDKKLYNKTVKKFKKSGGRKLRFKFQKGK